MQFQVRPNDDDGTPRIIDALSQKIHAESSLFSLQHIRQGFQRTVPGTQNRPAMTPVVQKGIDGFLKHPLFIAADDLRGLKVDQFLETIVAIDNTTVKIVQI